MAWGYRPDDGLDTAQDYSASHDYSEDAPDYSAMSDQDLGMTRDGSNYGGALRDDLLGDHRKKPLGDTFRDKYRETRDALDAAERGEAGGSNDGRDIGKQERDAKEPAWKTNLEAKRKAAQEAAKKKQAQGGSFFSRHKKGAIGGLVGLVLAGSMSVLMLPMVAIAEFGQIANWLKDTTQTVHEVATGARSMRNVMVSARVAAKAAMSAGARDYFQTSRVGMFGQMVGQNYLEKLRSSGIDVHESGLRGVYDGMTIDLDRLGGLDNGFYQDYLSDPTISDADKIKTISQDWRLPDNITIEDGKVVVPMTDASGKRIPYRDFLKTLRALAAHGNFRIGGEIGMRYAANMLGISSRLHPIKNMKEKTLDKMTEAWKKRKAESSGTSDTAHKYDAKTRSDSEGNVTDDSAAAADTVRDTIDAEAQDFANSRDPPAIGKNAKLKGALKGGALAVLMLGLCAIVNASHTFLAEMVQLTTTMAGQYQDTVSTWGQIQSAFMELDGGEIDMELLGVIHKDLFIDKVPDSYELDEDGSIVSDTVTYKQVGWTESPSYQATINGKTVSTDSVPTQVQNMYEENGGWGAAVGNVLKQIPGFDLAASLGCSEAAGWLLDALSFVGGWTNPIGWLDKLFTVAMHVPALQEPTANLISWAVQIGTGKPLDLNGLNPSQLAEVAFRGGQYVSNSNFAMMGGTTLTTAQAYQNQLMAQEWLDAEWKGRPLADRLFDASDYRSTVAQVVNGAGIDTMPSSVQGYFANFAKLIGAVPSFITSGLFGGRSAEAKAADSVSYDTGAPTVQLTPAMLQKITGCDASELDSDGFCPFDYPVNANKVFGLLETDGNKYREYSKQCLGLEIGSAPDYKVTAIDTPEEPSQLETFFGLDDDGSTDALLVGIQGGTSWNNNDCANKANDSGNDYAYARVALYAGLDYQILAGYAWYGTSEDDPETQKIAQELGFAASSGSSDSGSNSSLDFDSLLANFQSATGGSGDYDGGAGQQCVDVSAWFVGEYTTLNKSSGNGNDFAANMVAANPGIVSISSEPRSPAVFSAKKCDGSWATLYGGTCYGHTGLVIDVKDNGDGTKTLTTMEGWDGASPIGQKLTRKWTADSGVDFVYLGDVLKK